MAALPSHALAQRVGGMSVSPMLHILAVLVKLLPAAELHASAATQCFKG